LVMTSTDANGAGAFAAVAGPLGSSQPDLAVYEVLYADSFAIEYADIPCVLQTLKGGPAPPGTFTVVVMPTLAPFYTTPSAGRPTPTIADPVPTALPRFAPDTIKLPLPIAASLTGG
jgi:hypothetical protein